MLHDEAHIISHLSASLDRLFLLLENEEINPANPLIMQQKKEVIHFVEQLRHVHHFAGLVTRRSIERPIKLSECVEEVIYLNNSSTKSIRVNIDVPENVGFIRVPNEEFKTIIANLFQNALKAVKPNGTILIQARTTKRKLCITISDDGTGLPPELLENGLGSSFTNRRNASGMGLAVANIFVQRCGGKLEIGKRILSGATLSLEFPIKKGEILNEEDSMDR